ncbi:Molybdenum cofactor biosynthesis protein MoaB [hydrothermal vent metagenome]|uniref:Molybdenum cofactor biosynthesis protein MoaB n=1 Tax=hydrothermal vent metagenome TaxID=652676 RepID=A0A3B0ZNH8_9ZZZZ
MPDTSIHTVFKSINIVVLTVSDTRTLETDTSGKYLAEKVITAGHRLVEHIILQDNIYQLRATVSNWIANAEIQTILVTGGTGITGRDVTPEALNPLLDKKIEGFGELFRQLSYQEIKASTIQSRAFAGQANNTFIFCIPGSTGACKLAWESILKAQLDNRTQPCNFIKLLPRLDEV